MSRYDDGRHAYDAYCGHRDWKSFNGEPLPKWEEVKPDIQEGWILAAEAAIEKRASVAPERLQDYIAELDRLVGIHGSYKIGRDIDAHVPESTRHPHYASAFRDMQRLETRSDTSLEEAITQLIIDIRKQANQPA